MPSGIARSLNEEKSREIINETKQMQLWIIREFSLETKPSAIDVAVIVPRVEGDWLTVSTDLWLDVDKVNILIEPVLLEEGQHSPLYDDVMRTGVAV